MRIIRTTLDWVHLTLVASVLCLSTIGQHILVAFNALFPFPKALEQLYLRSQALQRLFRVDLGMRSARIEGRRTARELVEAEGFRLEDHHAVTADGFVLVMHRVLDPDRATSSDAASHRPVVLLMHGLMQDSESLLCGGRDHSLALRLAAAGFDVFLGNARGNRYSHKHLRLSPQTSDAYWNFSIDELASFDTPAMVEQTLKASGQSKLCYIGFSQGSAQAFAAFSSNNDLLDKICLFVALSPAARANHLSPSLLLSLVQANLRFIYLLFGRRRMVPVALTWQRIMSREFFITTIDVAVGYLFSWKASQVSMKRKFELYPHIYSYTSETHLLDFCDEAQPLATKALMRFSESAPFLAHALQQAMFRMMYSGRLCMFADSSAAQYIPVTYDVRRISCPVVLVHGGSDQLVEVETLKDTLPNLVVSIREEAYEHLDTMWADTAKDTVFPKVEALIRRFWPATNGDIQATIDL